MSVVFVDLEDFTGLAESLDPEDVRNLQSRYFEAARSVISHYGGTVEKFIGDAVMAVWGAPAAHEDDAERAVRAALEIVATVAKIRGAAPGRRLSARASVATGEAVVTIGLDGQGMVAGDLVNTAARLQGAAPTGAVLVDDTTRRVVGDAVAFDSAGDAALKGKRRVVGTWVATAVADETGTGGFTGHAGPFVGRSRELAELIDLHGRTIETRRSRLVSVRGIAGIGKSRLIWELLRHLEAAPQPVALHVGRAPSYGEGITFAPLAEMVRRRARITEGTETEVARRQLAAALVEFVPDQVEREWIEPRLATLLDPGSHIAYERDELFAAWRRFFEWVSEWAPAILLFEDLQWADAALLDFLDHLATWSRSHPILVLALARPELLDIRPTWGAGHHSITTIHLEPLADDAMAQLLFGLAPDLPPDVVQRVVEHAGGVPLYGVEVVRMLVDRGQARARDGRFELLEPVEDITIPETLHSLVSARIDTLPVTARGMLLSASVLGRRFHRDALAAISGLESSEARDRIAALIRRELLTVDDDLHSPGRGQLSFVQDVVREVAYRTLSRQERRTLHLAAADHLEALRDDELVEAVAEHLVEAHRAAPEHPGATEIGSRAVGALRAAAARALTLRVPARALAHLQRALEYVTDDTERAELRSEAASAARAAALFDLAEALLREAIDHWTATGRRDDAARARAQLASLLLATERHGSALDDLQAAMEGVADLAHDPPSVALSAQLARAHMLVGHDAQGLEWADRTITAAEALDLPAIAIDARITRGTARIHLGDEEPGLADLHRAIADAAELGAISAELRARNNLAWLLVADDPHAAFETARGGLELAERMGVGDMALQLADVTCAVSVHTADWDVTLKLLEEARDRPQAPSHRLGFGVMEATVGALRGDPRAGSSLDGLTALGRQTNPQDLAFVDAARAWLAFAEGRIEDARALARSAAEQLPGADQHTCFVLAARASLWLGDADGLAADLAHLAALSIHGRATAASALTLSAGAAALAGDARAAPMYGEVIETWRGLGLPMHLALALVERARLLGGPTAAWDAAEAESILQQLGASGLRTAIERWTIPEPTEAPRAVG